MLILGRSRLKDPEKGYATTFLRQLEEGLGLAHERGVKIVTNAGGLNPAGLADAIRKLAARVGVPVAVAHVEGDSLPVPDGFLTANAYLGGSGIAACLRAWGRHRRHRPGHRRGPRRRPGRRPLRLGPRRPGRPRGGRGRRARPGVRYAGDSAATTPSSAPTTSAAPAFPLAEIHADGSSVITKHDGTGGVVDLSTVTAQLLYETGGARYAGPDVTARLDTVRLTPDGPDRVRIERGARRGTAPDPQGRALPARRLAQRGRLRPHGPGHRGQGPPGGSPVRRCPGAGRCAAARGGGAGSWSSPPTGTTPTPRSGPAPAAGPAVVARPGTPTRRGRAVSGAAVANRPSAATRASTSPPHPERALPTGCSRPSTYRRGTSSTPPCCRTEAAKPLNHPPAPGCWRDLTSRRSPTRTPPGLPAAPPSDSSRAPAAATRAATPTWVSGCGTTTRGGGWRTS
ncbi:hypothetical protein SMICM304S_01220 [Streptomyces microflavus]